MDISADGAGIEVKPTTLRRGAARLAEVADGVRGDLTVTYYAVVPDPAVNQGWAATVAGDAVTAAASGSLARLAARGHELGDALGDAADAYERSDERAAERLTW
jgi:hypothetical protein